MNSLPDDKIEEIRDLTAISDDVIEYPTENVEVVEQAYMVADDNL